MVLKFSPSPDFLTCATKIFTPREKHVTRIYNRSVLILMMDGTLLFKEDGKLVSVERGEYYIQRHGLLQEGVPMDTLPIYFYIEFNGTYADGLNGLPLRGRFDSKRLIGLVGGMEELFKNHRANIFMLNSYTCRIFSELLEMSPSFDERSNTANLIKNFIRSRYADKITLSDVAKQFGYTEDHVIHIFRETYGITPHKYLTNIRLEHAKWLLEHTVGSTEEIAFSVGYTDFSSFFRAFRHAYGISPSAMRKELKKNEQ